MKKVLVLGATGAIGRAALSILRRRGLSTRALVQGEAGALRSIADEVRVGEVTDPGSLAGVCDEVDVVISALGKPVSLFSNDDSSFHEVDFNGNANVLKEAATHGVKRFVYISIFGSEWFGDDFAVARAHRDFEELLQSSGLGYAILRPVGLFSGMLDFLTMAKRGAVITLGTGESRTNPIHHEDLAQLAVERMEGENAIDDAGGPDVYTRWEIGELACRAMGCDNHVRLPELAMAAGLPLVNIYDRNFFDELAFFKEVLTHDVVAPPYGTHHLEDFLLEAAEKMKAASTRPSP